ncbi:unnamed protein product, partial [Meganyctiphanes norvegica]
MSSKPRKEDKMIKSKSNETVNINIEKEHPNNTNNDQEKGISKGVKRLDISNQDEEKENKTEIPEKKRRKDKVRKQRHKMKYASDSDSVSEIVSKALKECENAVMCANMSVDNVSSLSSVTDISSDVELSSTNSDSTTESLNNSETRQKENNYNRVESVGKMAQNLIQRIEKEEENLNRRIADGSNVTERTRNSGTRESLSKEPVAYSEIEAMSVDELIARMTRMLPATGVKKCKEEENLERSHKSESRSIPHAHGSVPHNGTSSTQQTSLLMKNHSPRTPPGSSGKLRDLVMPDTPVLCVSRNNGIQNEMINIGTPYVIKPEATPVLTPFSVQPIEFSLPGNNFLTSDISKSLPGLVDINSYRTNLIQENAARRIQAAYRGYCVRKITSHLIKKQKYKHSGLSGIYTEKVKQPSRRNKYFREKHFELIEDTSDKEEDTSLSEGPIEEVDWHKIRSELENQEQFILKEPEYIVQREDIPEWVKPYIVLSETGNVRKFLESKTKAELIAESHSVQNKDISKEIKNTKVKISDLSEIKTDRNNSDSDKEMFDDSSVILNNTTLSEGSLNDSSLSEGPLDELVDFKEPSLYEKETQTFFSGTKHSPMTKDLQSYSKSVTQGNGGRIKNNENSLHNFQQEQAIVADTDRKTDERNGKSSQRRKVDAKSVTYNNKKIKLHHKEEFDNISRSSLHDETLEEGLIEEFESSIGDTITSNDDQLQLMSVKPVQSTNSADQMLISSGQIVDSTRSVGHLQQSISPIVDSSFELTNYPSTLPHMGGASLRLRLNAELMYQDTMSEALHQLADVEQQEAHIFGAQMAVQQRQQEIENQTKAEQIKKEQERRAKENKREEELTKKAEEERKQEARRAQLKEDERRVEEKRRLLQEEEKRYSHQSNLAILSIERMEEEAKQRLAKLEQEIRERADRILAVASQQQSTERAVVQVAAQNSTNDVIAAAAAAAVGATISHWERFYPSNRSREMQIQTTQTVSEFPSYTSQEYSTTIIESNGSYSTQSHLSRSERRSSLIKTDDAYNGNISDSQSSVKSLISEHRNHVSVTKSKSSVEVLNKRENTSTVEEVLPSDVQFTSLSSMEESLQESLSEKENLKRSTEIQDISEDVQNIMSDKSKSSIFTNTGVPENIVSESHIRTSSLSSPEISHSSAISEKLLTEMSPKSKCESSSAESRNPSVISKSHQSFIPENVMGSKNTSVEKISTSILTATNSVPESMSICGKRTSESIQDESNVTRISEYTESSKDSESESSASHVKNKLETSQESLNSKSSESNKQEKRKVVESD